LFEFSRVVNSNQRISFDIDFAGRYLATGSQDGKLLMYDINSGNLVKSLQAHDDAVNGCHFHPNKPYIATTSGQRKFDLSEEYSDDLEMSQRDARLLIWQLNQDWIDTENKMIQETN